MIHQHPAQFGQPITRWSLAGLLAACPWLNLQTLPGLHQLLDRLDIHLKRGRGHLFSPDPDYIAKVREVWTAIRLAKQNPEQFVLLFQDELTFYRQPTLASDYERAGHVQPLAELGQRSNASWRIAGALNAWSGQLIYAGHSHFTLKLFVDFLLQIANTYPSAQTIYLAMDNWPVHFHPDVLAALQPQFFHWPRHCPKNWPTEPSKAARRLDLPIQFLPLPTYAPWTNPIEKVWLWLKKYVLHLHRFADDFAALKLRVNAELDGFAGPSPDLLHFVGLSDPLRLYRALHFQ